MNKLEVQQRVLKHGKPLALYKFCWDEEASTFSSEEQSLVMDFGYIDYVTFHVSYNCVLNTGWRCVFYTGSGCVLRIGSECVYSTGDDCVIITGWGSEGETGSGCKIIQPDVF